MKPEPKPEPRPAPPCPQTGVEEAPLRAELPRSRRHRHRHHPRSRSNPSRPSPHLPRPRRPHRLLLRHRQRRACTAARAGGQAGPGPIDCDQETLRAEPQRWPAGRGHARSRAAAEGRPGLRERFGARGRAPLRTAHATVLARRRIEHGARRTRPDRHRPLSRQRADPQRRESVAARRCQGQCAEVRRQCPGTELAGANGARTQYNDGRDISGTLQAATSVRAI